MTKARTLADNYAADINQVSAGVGITGGGTSGTVTITNDMATTIDAKGDLVVGTGADTYSRLAVASTAGYLLSVDSSTTTGLKWAAPAGGGKVLQVVQGSYATTVSVASSTYADTGLSASITPSATSSKVLVLVSLGGCGTTGNLAAAQFKLFRSTTEIQLIEMAAGYKASAGFATSIIGTVSAVYLDSPSTTSSTTYKIQIASKSGESSSVMNYDYSGAYGVTPKSTITLLEIGA